MIGAFDVDISRTLEKSAKFPIEQRRAEYTAERKQVTSRMAEIETKLADAA
jgi:hypothetical protein